MTTLAEISTRLRLIADDLLMIARGAEPTRPLTGIEVAAVAEALTRSSLWMCETETCDLSDMAETFLCLAQYCYAEIDARDDDASWDDPTRWEPVADCPACRDSR